MVVDASEIERTAVIGTGLMGTGLVQILAQAGCQVYVVSRTDHGAKSCVSRVRDGIASFVRSGLLDEGQVGPIMSRIRGTSSLERAVGEVQFAIESVIERLDVKQELFEKLDRYAPAKAVLATNTSGLSLGEIADRVSQPERVVGSHFFHPHTLVPLVEVGCGPRTSDETVATAVSFWRRCGKEPVVCRKDINGFLVNRLSSALMREAMSLVAVGAASIVDLDLAMQLGIGIRLALTGIFQQRDWGGLDVHYATASSIYPTLEDTKSPLPILADRVARGETGVKSGKGFYDWTGLDVEALRQKRERQLIKLIQVLKEILPELERPPENEAARM